MILTETIGNSTVETVGAEHDFLTVIKNKAGDKCVFAMPARDENSAITNHSYIVGQVKEGSMGYFETIKLDEEE